MVSKSIYTYNSYPAPNQQNLSPEDIARHDIMKLKSLTTYLCMIGWLMEPKLAGSKVMPESCI